MNFMRTTMLLAALTAIFMGVGYLVGGTGGMFIALLVAAGHEPLRLLERRQDGAPDERRPRGRRAHRARVLRRSSRSSRRRPASPCRRSTSSTARSRTPSPPAAIPENAAVAATTGLLRSLRREEIAAVMAHELGHVKNRDTLTMTITATIAGAVSMLANFALFFGGGSRDNNNPLGFVGVLVAALVAPIAAMLVQMAVSRTREYSADRAARRDHRPAVGACLGAREDPQRRASDSEPCRRAQSGDGASLHHQPALGRPDGQPVLDPPLDREPHRRAWRRWRASSAGVRRRRAPRHRRPASRCPASGAPGRPSTVRVARGAEPEVNAIVRGPAASAGPCRS